MIASQSSTGPDKKPVLPGMNLRSNPNNPFLNPKLASPGIPTPTTPSTAPARPMSTNPFLAAFEQDLENRISPADQAKMDRPVSRNAPTINEDAKELFKRLTVTDEDNATNSSKLSPRGTAPTRERGHRSNRSNEQPQFRKGPNGLLIPLKPKDRRVPAENPRDRRSRRNSDPATDRQSMVPEEREARDKRRRDRASKHQRNRSQESKMTDVTVMPIPGGSSNNRTRRNKHVDVVDKLDVTGLYGVGGMWHHDGPFDACRPQRNRKKDSLAPMSAFPTNSANQTMGGSGPVNKNINLEQFHGRGAEGFNDYGGSNLEMMPKPAALLQPQVMNATNRVEPVHGEETMGLGTSTFLEGAPASRAAMQRTKSETTGVFDGISRKKSIAMRFRGMSQSKSRPYDAAPPNPALPGEYAEASNSSPVKRKPMRRSDSNAQDSAYDQAYDKKGVSIREAEVAAVAPSSPTKENMVPLSRRSTTDGVSRESPEPKSPKGILGRVKSLKGGKGRGDRNAS